MKSRSLFSLIVAAAFSHNLFSQSPTWSDGIGALIYRKCTVCHNTGGLAPFALESYDDAAYWSYLFSGVITARIMPPWPPVPSYRHYVNERVLTQAQIDSIVSWVNAGTPEGNPANAPAPPLIKNGPLLGTPDVKLSIPVYTSQATTTDEYACFVLPTGFTQDKYVRGIQIMPGNRAIVHHVIIQLDTAATVTDCMLGLIGGAQTMYSWASGMEPVVFPNSNGLRMGMRIKAGSNILVQIHYPEGTAGQIDSTSILFYLYSDAEVASGNPPIREIKEDLYVMNWFFTLPPNEVTTLYASWPYIGTTTEDLSLFAVDPHMHLLGRSMISYAVTADNDTIPLNKIDNWDFEWQSYYFFKNLVKIPAGSKIYGEAVYDNTSNNPNNPFNPPRLCLPGQNTTDEMMLIAYQYTTYQPGDENYDIEAMVNEAIRNAATAAPDIKSSQLIELFAIYPNPSDGLFVLSPRHRATGAVEITVCDILGQKVLTLNIDKPQWPVNLNIATQPDGIYLMQIRNGNSRTAYKIIVAKR